MKPREISANAVLITCIIVFSFVPDVGVRFHTVGFTWTAYRLAVVACFTITLIRKKCLHVRRSSTLFGWMLLLCAWLICGVLLLVAGSYTDRHNGLVELLSVLLGLLAMYVLYDCIEGESHIWYAIKLIYVLLNAMLVLGLIEIATGKHLPMSFFNDATSEVAMYDNTHFATGLLYNLNDFSAMITCMSVVLLDERFGAKRFLTLIGVLIINLVNDATICSLAMVVPALYYFLWLKGGTRRAPFVCKVILWGLCLSGLIVLVYISEELVNSSGLFGALARQIHNAQYAGGSLYVRIIMYRDTLSAWVSTGLLGSGPASFTNYFAMHPSTSGLVNPHSLFFEVLFQYGFIIAGWLIWELGRLFIRAKREYELAKGDSQKRCLMIVIFVLIYSVACFAPSKFISYGYQWTLIAIMCIQLDVLIRQRKDVLCD